MFSYFESLINPYPHDRPTQPPHGLLAFCWHYSKDVWHILALLSFTVAVLSAVEVVLFSFLGKHRRLAFGI